MKTKLIIPALLAFGFCSAPLFAQSEEASVTSTELALIQDKVKVEVDRLPEQIKESIANDDRVGALQVTEAWQVTDEDGSMHYLIKFDDAGEEVEKKYNAQGEEIED